MSITRWMSGSVVISGFDSFALPATPYLVLTPLVHIEIVALVGMAGWTVRLEVVCNTTFPSPFVM